MTQNRKRTRNPKDETEFMPLSKRINNLHINTMLQEQNLHLTNSEWCSMPSQSNVFDQRLPESPNGSEPSTESIFSPQYCPDLDEAQNPHYFNINKLLYEMYLERMNRGCQQV